MIRLAPRRVVAYSTTRGFASTGIANSGHNKWSTIKHDKAKNDALKNAVATKHAKSIAVAAKLGGADMSINFQLQTAVDQAMKANVSKKVVENAIKRGSGSGTAAQSQQQADFAVYEGMMDGVSFVVEALTDNKARCNQNVRVCFTKLAGTFAPTMYMFTKRGFIKLESALDDKMMDHAIESGAEDIEAVDDTFSLVTTDPQATNKVVQNLRELGYTVADFGLEYAPNEDTAVPASSLGEEKVQQVQKLIQRLEDNDEVTNVYCNMV